MPRTCTLRPADEAISGSTSAPVTTERVDTLVITCSWILRAFVHVCIASRSLTVTVHCRWREIIALIIAWNHCFPTGVPSQYLLPVVIPWCDLTMYCAVKHCYIVAGIQCKTRVGIPRHLFPFPRESHNIFFHPSPDSSLLLWSSSRRKSLKSRAASRQARANITWKKNSLV